MKKSLLTLSLVALFAVAANAQDDKAKKTKEPAKTANKENSSTVAPEASTAPSSGAETTPKKSGTRMAINEKGMPGNTKTSSTTSKKDEKPATTTNPK